MIVVAGSCFYLAPPAGKLMREPAQAPAAANSSSAEQPPAPAEQLKALLAEYDAGRQAYLKATNDGDSQKTPPDQYKEAREKWLRQIEMCAARCVRLADKHPQDPAAMDALLWVVSNTSVVRTPENSRIAPEHVKALQLLRRDHIRSAKLGPFCRWLAIFWDEEGTSLAERILAENPHRTVQAEALLRLAESQLVFSRRLADSRKDPGNLERYVKAGEKLYGAKFAKTMQNADAVVERKEAERLFERLTKEYGDLPDPETGTLGKRASHNLHALRAPLIAGQQAPEIEGKDIDGKKLKLTDFRGKAVLLVFTGDWCGACLDFYAQQRSLLKDLAGKPLALVDVNCDEILERRKKINAQENVTWPAFQERLSDGPIAARWGIGPCPALFLIDHKGAIRQMYVGSPGEKTLKAELDKLIKEAEAMQQSLVPSGEENLRSVDPAHQFDVLQKSLRGHAEYRTDLRF
jgi:peroxiredoxin